MSEPVDLEALFRRSPMSPGPVGDRPRSGSVVQAPISVTTEVERRLFPNGQAVEIGTVTTAGADRNGTLVTEVVEIIPTLHCGCSPASGSDIYSCGLPDCDWLACGAHCWTCQLCGVTACSRHVVAHRQDSGAVVVLCRACATPEPWWRRLWRTLFKSD